MIRLLAVAFVRRLACLVFLLTLGSASMVMAQGDTTKPTVAITNPANNARPTTFTIMQGTASDNVGVTHVNVALYHLRLNVRYYWDFPTQTWTTTAYYKTATYNGLNSTWAINSGLPTGNDLKPLHFYITAIAYDPANNNQSASSNFYIDTDNIAPTATIFSPANGSTKGHPVWPITGTATDTGGSVVSRVTVQLQRTRHGVSEGWDFVNGLWASLSSAIFANQTYGSSINWGVNTNLPAGAIMPVGSDLPDGAYTIKATPRDDVDNGGATVASAFTMTGGYPRWAQNLTAAFVSNSAQLSWDAAPGATSYKIKRSTSVNGPFSDITVQTGTTYTDNGQFEFQSGVTY